MPYYSQRTCEGSCDKDGHIGKTSHRAVSAMSGNVEIAGLDITGLDNDGRNRRGGHCRTGQRSTGY